MSDHLTKQAAETLRARGRVRYVGWKDAAGNIPYVEDRRAKVPVAAKPSQVQAQRKRERQNRRRARSR